MDTWSPLSSRIVDSSLWEEDDIVIKVFLTMLAKKDADNVVRGSAFNISRWAKKTEEETLKALKVLSSPDTRRIEPQAFDGRRIGKVDDGWLILNADYYRSMISKFKRKDYNRQWMAEYRAMEKKLTPGQKDYIKRVRDMGKQLRHWHKLSANELGVNGNPTAKEIADMDGEYKAATMQEKDQL
jgi:hypothetical protein